MVAMVFLHMLRVFYTGAYRPPKEFNWVIGVILLLVTILLSYTGYLLPWDQLSFWGISVGTNMIHAVPFGFGDKIAFLLLGGNIVGENALVRFYVLHCFVIPVVAIVLMAIHFWRVRKDGGV
jgi:quinol-cytochrome oxidoreductase complex cytochrome b subunit